MPIPYTVAIATLLAADRSEAVGHDLQLPELERKKRGKENVVQPIPPLAPGGLRRILAYVAKQYVRVVLPTMTIKTRRS